MGVVEELREAVRATGLFARDRPLLAMISGGRDSTCLLDVAVALLGADAVFALHVNYGAASGGRRGGGALPRSCAPRSASSSRSCARRRRRARRACRRQAERGGGNLQAWAREVRYGAAEQLAAERDALIATGHTASDQVETILYRLAASPGRRALLGMPAAEGRLVRPLLGVTREQTGAYCAARGLAWTRGREQRGSALRPRAGAPRARAGAARGAPGGRVQRAAHRVAAARGDRAARRARGRRAGRSRRGRARAAEGDAPGARAARGRAARRAGRRAAYVPQAGERVGELLELGRRGGRAELHVGGRAGAVIEDGVLRMVRLPPRAERRPADL